MTFTPILMYHETGVASEGAMASWTVSPAQFGEHLNALEAAGYTGVSVARWLAARHADQRERMAVLTFDDGLAGNIEHAVPMLQARGWTGTFFVISGRMGDAGFGAAGDWRATAEAGMDIASHTVTHPFMATLSAEAARRELADSRSMLEQAIRSEVTGFSWPNGDAHRAAAALLRETGYRWAATSRAGFATERSNALDLPRLAVRSWHDAAGLERLLDHTAARRARMAVVCQTKWLARSVLGRALYARLQSRVAGDG